MTLARAFVHLHKTLPDLSSRLRLVLVGEGPVKTQVARLLEEAGLSNLAWLPGERNDIPQIMRALDLFVLPSLAEGVSNTVLEAMASGLPVIATRVGGNPELVEEGVTGRLVPASDHLALAAAIQDYVHDRTERIRAGHAARAAAEKRFSMEAMTSAYSRLYEHQFEGRSKAVALQQ